MPEEKKLTAFDVYLTFYNDEEDFDVRVAKSREMFANLSKTEKALLIMSPPPPNGRGLPPK